MRIYILNRSATFGGGAERVALTTAAALARRGHRVTVLAAHGPVAPELEGITNLDLKLADPDAHREPSNWPQRLQFLWPDKVGEFLRSNLDHTSAPSILHYHSGYLEFGIPGFRAMVRSRLPLVYTHHDYAWACPLMGFYDYRKQAMCPLEGGSISCLLTDCVNSRPDKLVRFSRHVGTHITSGILDRVRHHVFVSNTSREKLSGYLKPGATCSILPNPAEFTWSDPAPIHENARFAWVGRLTVEKDPEMLALAANAVGKRVTFIGDGPLREAVATADPEAQITGWISAEQVRATLANSRALVMTSRWLEAAPLVLAEAFSAGLPAVVPSQTAAAEFVENGKTGYIYRSNSPESLQEALCALSDSDHARTLGAEAYRRFWSNPPTMDAHLDQLERIYEQVLAVRS